MFEKVAAVFDERERYAALAGVHTNLVETIQADPEVILHLWGITPSRSMADTRASIADHPVGSQLSAVQNDRVHATGMCYQGPLMNLFQIEMGAKQLYSDRFDEWPGYEDGGHGPAIPEDEQLFDRQHVADIVRGRI